MCNCTYHDSKGGRVGFAYLLRSQDDFNKSKKPHYRFFFSITHPFDKFKEIFAFFIYLGKYGLCTIVHIITQ